MIVDLPFLDIQRIAKHPTACCKSVDGWVSNLIVMIIEYLRENKLRHNFQKTITPLCSCSLEIESTFHFFSALPKFHHPKNQSHE